LDSDTSSVTATDPSMPIVCSLAADAAVGDRESQWRELLSRAVIRRTRAPAGVRIELRALPGVRRELERLVAAERDCCPFMTMSVETTDDQVLVLAVAAPAQAAAIVERLFEGKHG
jgi:hypothetical protein